MRIGFGVNVLSRPQGPIAPPANGATVEIAPGLLWLRLGLPFRLDHVNVYLIDDGHGWVTIDTGAGDAPTIAAWTGILEAGPTGPLGGRPITRIVVTHHHPDHVGAAAFLAARTGATLLMGETEYLTAALLLSIDETEDRERRAAFHRFHGVSGLELDGIMGQLGRYRDLVPALPRSVLPLRDRDRLRFGDRHLAVMDAPGHAPAQMILHQADANLLFVADQVLTRITPNVGVLDGRPDDDPLGRFLASLAHLRAMVPDGGLVLPGHHLPFRTLHARIGELMGHHQERCAAIEDACASDTGMTAAELVPILFPLVLDAHQFGFAFSEILAHLNYLAARGRLAHWDARGRRRWRRTGRPSPRF